MFISDKRGFAGGYLVILALLILGSFIIIEVQSFYNEILSANDNLATDGLITDNVHTYYETYTSAVKFLAVIVVIGVLAWGYTYATEHRMV